jgi:tocopherol O-methyltransferase
VLTPDLVTYYTTTAADYRRWWSPDHLHFGLWTRGVRSHAASLDQMSALVVALAGVRPGGRYLDAGCGVGGTIQRALTWVPEARCDGITLVPAQAAAAQARIPPDRGTVWCGDYRAVPVPADTYDGVWFLESFCHTAPGDVPAVIAECTRLVRPGGRVVIADGWAGRPPATPTEAAWWTGWLASWALPGLHDRATVAAAWHRAGWTVWTADLTPWVLPSARRLGRLAAWSRPLRILPGVPAWTRQHVAAAEWAWRCAVGGLIRYGVLVAIRQAA